MSSGHLPEGSNAWDSHWEAIDESKSLFGRIASLVRTQLLSRAVAAYAERYFPKEGLFLECGCGTGQSSQRLKVWRRQFIAVDFSLPALRSAQRVRVFSQWVQGDIRALPYPDGSVAGIWNLGVMEHFTEAEGIAILREFRRVLSPGARALLFWPPEFGSSRWVLAPIERWRSRKGASFHFFPDEVNRLSSRSHARAILLEAGFEPEALDFTFRDGLIHLVVVARKTEP